MRNLLVIAACSSLLAACAQEQEATQVTSTFPIEAGTVQSPTDTGASCEGSKTLPDGLTFDSSIHIASDRIATRGNGKSRRTTTIEYLFGTQQEMMAQASASMLKAGFTERSRDTNAHGAPVQSFHRRDVGLVVLTYPEIPEAGSAHPSAKGRIVVNSPYSVPIEPSF